jgi:hypothetical protein
MNYELWESRSCSATYSSSYKAKPPLDRYALQSNNNKEVTKLIYNFGFKIQKEYILIILYDHKQ